MINHTLRIEEKYARRLFQKKKRYELRKNDRDFQVGDLIGFSINSFEDGEWKLPMYEVTHVLQDIPQFGLESGYCILSLEEIKE